MRPCKLTMSAFGSYAGEEVIDFSGIDQGIFLVTGDTGAGKTTIFDGIVYALYDRTSGGIRDGNMMRSAYADLRTPTFVELEFLCRGERYRILRNPDYKRESLRKDKDGNPRITQEKSKVELYLPDGSLFRGNKKEVNHKIEEILGMDARQFMQMAMIAQGDFLKLLHAKSEDRKEIFSRIFDTRLYASIQEELKRQEKECFGKLRDREQACREQIGRIICPENSPYKQDLDICRETDDIRRALQILAILEKEEKEREKELFQKKEEWKKKIRHISKTLEVLLELSSVREKRKQYLLWLEENLPLEKNYQNAEEQSEKAFRNQEEILRTIKGKVQEEEEQFLESSKKVEARYEEMKGLKKLWEKAARFSGEQREKAELWKKADEDYRKTRQRYDALYERFIREQAGILAQELIEGEPCPVCGSRMHPQKAAVSEHAPDQNEVKQAKKKTEYAEQAREQAQEKYAVSAQAYQAALGSLNQEGRRLFGEQFDASDPSYRQRAGDAMREASASMENFRKEYEEKKRQDGEAVQKQELVLKTRKKEWKDAKEARESFIRQVERIRGGEAAAGERAERLEKEWGKHAAFFAFPEAGDGQKEFLQKEAERLDRENQVLEKEYQECHASNRTNGETKKILEKYWEEYEKIRDHFTTIRHLSRTAGGTLTGSAGLDFESFIQRRYFKEIIRRANQRLIRMSSGQFLLKCRDMEQLGNRGKVGLDLDVYSLVTESVRDVKTLSGGESFMAALSMALGLADTIQDSTGAIRLDTMFIDEGFGSLDENSREQAVRVLYELAGENRLIGIISHVTELKEQIAYKLTVTKGKNGSHVVNNFMKNHGGSLSKV